MTDRPTDDLEKICAISSRGVGPSGRATAAGVSRAGLANARRGNARCAREKAPREVHAGATRGGRHGAEARAKGSRDEG